MKKLFDVDVRYKQGINPLTNQMDAMVCLTIKEFFNGVENTTHKLYIEFALSWVNEESCEWEKEQIRHYFEYEHEPFDIYCNDKALFSKLYEQ